MGKFCEKCGMQLQDGAAFCSKCGAATGSNTPNKGVEAVKAVPELTFSNAAQEKKKDKKAVVISIATVVAVLILAVTAAVLYLRSDGYQCKKNMKLAEESFEAEEYKKALSYYKKALELDGTLAEAYIKSADIYVMQDSFEDARKILKRGLKKIEDEESIDMLNDSLVEVYLSEADAYLSAGEYRQAIAGLKAGQADIENGDKLENKLVEVYIAEADSYLSTGNYEWAISVLKEGQAYVGENNVLLEDKLAYISAQIEAYLAEVNQNEDGNDIDSGDMGGNDTVDSGEVEYGSGEIKIWVPEHLVYLTEKQADAFIVSNPDMSGYTVSVEMVYESDMVDNMITDIEGGADIYVFSQDKITNLISAGALCPITGADAEFVSSQNDAGAASAAVVGGTTYAYPMTSDNGYFLYYDSSVVTAPTSLEQIVADCEATGRNFYMGIDSGWYQPAFFFATGCTLTYDTDEYGNFCACHIDYASDAGLVALKEIIELASSPAFRNGSSVDNETNIGAIVSGTWDSESAKATFGDNYACAKLPSFEGSDGKTYQLSGFGGFKLLGIKPQGDVGKLAVCNAFAQYLTSEDAQIERYEETGYGPSNLAAQRNSTVRENEALSALTEQLAYAIPQGNYPGDYWMSATAFGDDIITGKLSVYSSDEDLMAALQAFQDTCISYAW